MHDELSSGAVSVAGPSNAIGNVGGDPAPGEREELEAQIKTARQQMAEVAAARSLRDAVQMSEKLGDPEQRLRQLQYALQWKFPASACLPLDTSSTSVDTAAEEKRAPVVIHAAQKSKTAPEPSRAAFEAVMKNADKPARISFPKFIAQQMKVGQCSAEALDLQTVTGHAGFKDQHQDVKKLVEAFLALPGACRGIRDVLSRIDNATKEIERELALATPAPVLVRKPKKKPDRAALINAFDDCLATSGATGVTREGFVFFLAQLLCKKDSTAANLSWQDTTEMPGFKKLDFRVQAALDKFLMLTPDERASHDVVQSVQQEVDKKAASVVGRMAAEANDIELLPGESHDEFGKRFLAANPKLAAIGADRAVVSSMKAQAAKLPKFEALRKRMLFAQTPGMPQIDAHGSERKLPSQPEDSDSTDSESYATAKRVVTGLKELKMLHRQGGADSSDLPES